MKQYEITIDGQVYQVSLKEISAADAQQVTPAAKSAEPPTPVPAATSSGNGTTINAPMAGNVIKINCQPGQNVKAGDVLIILEAMKMENEIVAPEDGVISNVFIKEGDSVSSGQKMLGM